MVINGKTLQPGTAFWDTLVKRKLEVERSGLWKFLEHPSEGVNSYMESIERNLATIRERIAGLEQHVNGFGEN